MEIKCHKVRARDQLRFTVDFSDEEINKIIIYSHELKCYVLNQDDKYLNTKEYIYDTISTFDEYSDKGLIIFDFIYTHYKYKSLMLTFALKFTRKGIFIINSIILEHVRDKKYIEKNADTVFRNKTCAHVKEILNILINRNNLGFFCGTCTYKFKHNLSRQCLHIYKRVKK